MIIDTYMNGPEGIPRVTRMTDGTIDELINRVLRNRQPVTEAERVSLRDIAHLAAEEILACLPNWPEQQAAATAPELAKLSPAEIDDMAFGYVPSAKIGELREFAQVLMARMQGAQIGPNKLAGWIQLIDGVQTQNFARDGDELKVIKDMFAVMGGEGKAEYIPVYRLQAPANRA